MLTSRKCENVECRRHLHSVEVNLEHGFCPECAPADAPECRPTVLGTCDDCGRVMVEDKEAHEHPQCVLGFCDGCMSGDITIGSANTIYAHHIVGKRVG